MRTTIAKKSCKCHICGAQINVGDKVKWYEHVRHGHGEWSGKSYSFSQWKLICLSGCGERLLEKENLEKQVKEIENAKFVIEQLKLNPGVSQENIDNMVYYFKQKGIDVNE